MRSLTVKLTLAFLAIAFISVGMVGFLANRATQMQFGSYLEQNPWLERMGPGMALHMQRMMLQMFGPPERRFLARVNRAIWLSALASGILATILGLLLTRQLTAPLRELATAARRIGRGELRQMVEVYADDELGEVAQAFNAMAAALNKQEELRRQLLADIAHELGTPLAVIQGNLEGMLDGVIEPTAERLASLHTHVGLLARLVKDLRDLSLAQAGQLTLHPERLDLARTIQEIIEVVRPRAEEKGITLVTSVDTVPPVLVDPHRLAQVLHNLLDNALRHTPPGGTVEIVARQENKMVRVSVRDTGSGIPPEDLPHVFDRFYRVDRSRSRATGGTGLGLAVVKHVVEASGGQVFVESKMGQGSTFSFTLPMA
ncbi:MAG: ATP-binding protein [Armatimonadota bacterium]|nr:ATP-binding protein [Armatimonadota bacterium]